MSIRSISPRAAAPVLPVLIILLGLAGGLATAPLSATSYVMMPDTALVDSSPVAAVVRIAWKDREAALRQGGAPVTEYGIEVEEALKGQIPGGTAVVRVPGGVARNGLALKVFGAPRFAVGDRAILFLEPAEGGAYRVMHLMLGAFREVRDGGRSLAVRSLAEARELRSTAAGIEEGAGQDRLRDFDAFARWVADRAGRTERSADYFVEAGDGIRRAVEDFTLFEDEIDGFNLRWFVFDTAGQVLWKAYKTGQSGVNGGGYTQFQTALTNWNNEPQTPISYQYNGTTSVKNGLLDYDTVNAILFNDPNNELPAFSCATGGVLAYGGPWYEKDPTSFKGSQYHRIVNGDVVINNGLTCFFQSSPNGGKAAEELFSHELGHTLGLNHSCGDLGGPDPNCTNATFSDAVMRAYVHDDGRGGTLNSDDQAGVRFLYSILPAVPAAPTNLVATPQSTTAINLAWQDNATTETGYEVEMHKLGDTTFAKVLTLPANSTAATVSGLEPATGYVFRVRAVNATGASGYSNEASAATNAPIAPCVPDDHTLCLNSGRFRVAVEWETSSGDKGVGSVVPVTSNDSGLFWFFGEDNWEMLLKVLDGCGSNDHYWVFFAATTDVEFVVTVTDTQTGKVKPYLNPLGHAANAVTDTSAFATCP